MSSTPARAWMLAWTACARRSRLAAPPSGSTWTMPRFSQPSSDLGPVGIRVGRLPTDIRAYHSAVAAHERDATMFDEVQDLDAPTIANCRYLTLRAHVCTCQNGACCNES